MLGHKVPYYCSFWLRSFWQKVNDVHAKLTLTYIQYVSPNLRSCTLSGKDLRQSWEFFFKIKPVPTKRWLRRYPNLHEKVTLGHSSIPAPLQNFYPILWGSIHVIDKLIISQSTSLPMMSDMRNVVQQTMNYMLQ